MAKVKAPPPVHLDLMGNPIAMQASVVTHYRNALRVGVVVNSTPKYVRLRIHNQGHGWDTNTRKWVTDGFWRETLRVPEDVIVVDSPDILMYILKNSK